MNCRDPDSEAAEEHTSSVVVDAPSGSSLQLVVISVVLATVGLGIAAASVRIRGDEFAGRDELVTLFNLDSEYNVPTIVSALGLAACAMLLSVLSRVAQSRGSLDARPFRWLASIFLLLAFDEGARLHERLNEPMAALGLDSGPLRFGWVLVGGLLVLVLIPIYLPLVLRLPSDIRAAFIIAAVSYITGALALEMVGARIFNPENASYIVLTVGEELLELAGVGIFLVSLYRLLRRWAPQLTVMFPS